MNKKIFLLVCIFALVSSKIAAASFEIGVAAGYDYNFYDIKTQYAYDFRYTNGGGLTVGVPTKTRFNDWLGLRTDLVYLQKNYSMHRSGGWAGSYTNYTNHYLQLPVMANFSFGGERLRGYVNVGGYVGAWLASRRQGENVQSGQDLSVFGALGNGNHSPYKFDEKREFTPEDSRVDAGLAGSLGIEWKANDRFALFLETGCNYGLVSTHKICGKVSPNPTYNTTVFVQLGLLISTEKIKK